MAPLPRTQQDRFPYKPGAGADLVLESGRPAEQLRMWFAGEAFPRIIIDPTSGQVRSGDGTVAPTSITTGIGGLPALMPAHLFIGNASGVATDVALSGDATLSNAGVLTLAAHGPGVAGPIGDATHVPVLSIDGQGRLVALASVAIAAGSMPAGGTTGQLVAKLSNTNFDFTYVNPAPLAIAGQIPAQEPVIGAVAANVGSAAIAARADHDHAFPLLLGSGPPTGVTAPKGWLYSNKTATTTTTRLYVNTDGGTTWTNLTTAA